MIECVCGLIGGGKTSFAVVRSLLVMSRGGVVYSNILFTGLQSRFPRENTPDGLPVTDIAADSPAVQLLRSRYGWEYQERQYRHLDWAQMSDGFHKHVAPGQFGKPVLLIVDEANEWLDSLDRGRLNADDNYRAMFRFFRQSRHVAVDVLLIVQAYNSLNNRIRDLVGRVWKSTNMNEFRIPGVGLAWPLSQFLWQEYDRFGKVEIRKRFVLKDKKVWACYMTQELFGDLGVMVQTENVTYKKRLSNGRKAMELKDRLFLVVSMLLVFVLFGVLMAKISALKGQGAASVEKPAGGMVGSAVASMRGGGGRPNSPQQVNALPPSPSPALPPDTVQELPITYQEWITADSTGVVAWAGGRPYWVGEQLENDRRVVEVSKYHVRAVGTSGELWIFHVEPQAEALDAQSAPPMRPKPQTDLPVRVVKTALAK